MLKETAEYLEQYTQDPDLAKASLARITRESLMAWLSLYGDEAKTTPEDAASQPVEDTLPEIETSQKEASITPKFLIDVEPLPESYRPGKRLPFQIIRASRRGYISASNGSLHMTIVDFSMVETMAFKNAGYNIRFFENFPDGPYGGLEHLTVVAASDSETKNKIDQIQKADLRHPQYKHLPDMIEVRSFETCLKIYTELLQKFLGEHPELRP